MGSALRESYTVRSKYLHYFLVKFMIPLVCKWNGVQGYWIILL